MNQNYDKSPTWNDLDQTSPGLDPTPKFSRNRFNQSPANVRNRFTDQSSAPLEETINLKTPKKTNLHSLPNLSNHLAQAFNNQSLQKTKKKYVIAFIIIFLFFPVARVAIVSYSFSTYINESSGLFSATKKALFTGAYCYTTQVLTSITNCGTGTLIDFDVFPGTNAGCYCPTTNTVESRDCSSSSCTSVSALPSSAMSIWRGFQLCGTFASFTRGSPCPSGYRVCGINSFFCVEGSSCGISDLVLTTTGGSSPSSSYTTVTVNATVKLYYLVDTEIDNQLSSFSINHDLPCLSRGTYHTRTGFDASHPLETVDRTGCGVYEENYGTKIIDSYYEDIVYGDNSVSYSSVPLFSNYVTSQPVNLVANYLPKMNGQITWATCGNMTKVCTFVENVEKLKNTFDPVFIILFYVEIFALFLLVVHTLLAHNLSIYPLKGANFRFSSMLVVWIFVVVYVGLVVALMVDSSSLLKVDGSTFTKDFKTMATTRCFVDEYMNDAFSNFNDYVTRLDRQGYFLMAIWGATFLQGIVTFVVHNLLGNLEKKITPV